MKNSLYDYKDYKKYLNDFIRSQNSGGHGFRTRLASALGCHITYVSQVLNKDAHFSLEQSDQLNSFLGHTKDEAHYFLLLVQLERAGTVSLKSKFQDQINMVLEKRLILKDRVDIKKALSPIDQTQYYSAWHYAAVHILVTIPEFQTKDAIGERLGISIEKVSAILEFLTSIGLVMLQYGRYKNGVNRIFLGNDSLMISKHHTNWRMKAIESLDRESAEDVHFSTVVSFAHEDTHRIKEYLIKSIEGAREIVRNSKKEEEMHCFSLDFFKI
jgi:uncharacterized protein (TIGR02147 family)